MLSRLLRRLVELIRRLIGGDKPSRPKAGGISITFVSSREDDMGSLRMVVTHPVLREDGSTFDPLTELKGWRAATRVVGAQTWTPVGDLNPPSVTERTVGNAPPGEYEGMVTWEDIYDQVSAPAIDSTEVPVPAKPAPGGLSLTFVP